MNIDILRAHFGPGDDGKSFFDFVFAASDKNTVDLVELTLRNVTGVTNVADIDAQDSQHLDAESPIAQTLAEAG